MEEALRTPAKARPRPRWSRSTSGCLTCRQRRKKCDEGRPSCQGCERNCLICRWPPQQQEQEEDVGISRPPTKLVKHHAPVTNPMSAAAADSPRPQTKTGTRNRTRTVEVLSAMPSMLPPAYRDPGNRRLLDHFISVTARRMAGRVNPENPFLTYNLQIAIGSEMMQHTILAISSSHLMYSDASQLTASRAHYAVALRGIKHALTRWDSARLSERLTLLATTLTLCWFEVIDVNVDGAIFHHLRASRSMLRTLLRDDAQAAADRGLLGFFAEQYAYLVLVSNISFRPGRLGRRLEPELPCQSLEELNHGTQIYGCLFGCSHQLYQSIPTICLLARRRQDEGVCASASSISQYHSLLDTIRAWQPDPDSADHGFEEAGRMYQLACLVFLHTSFHGARAPTTDLFRLIDPLVEAFVASFSRLSYESAAWTTISWPVLVAGSCMRDRRHRDAVAAVVRKSTFQMLAVEHILRPLALLWADMDAGSDVCAYGPYGLETILDRHQLNLCVG